MIYHHFGSKDGLYLAVVDHLRREAGVAMTGIISRADGLSPYPAMRVVLGGMFDQFRSRPHLIAMLAHEGLAGQAVAPFPTADQLPAGMRAIYRDGQQEGTFRSDLPFEIAYMTTIGALVGLSTYFAQRFTESLGGGGRTDLEYLREQIVSQLVDGLSGPTGTTH